MEKKKHKTSVGGQALIEGVMMNGPKGAAMAVRTPTGEIQVEPKEFKRLKDKSKFFAAPIVRGVVNFAESMVIGYKCLMASAEISGELEDDEKPENMSKLDRWLNEHMGKKMFAVLSVIATVLAFGICFLLFFYAPTKLFEFINAHTAAELKNFQPLFEGAIKMVLLVVYMILISRTKDIKRVFMYHGAEHKSIFCYEAGEDLTVENVQKCRRFHPRCGTSFIFVVLLVSVLLSTVLRLVLPDTVDGILWVGMKLLLLPLIMGIGYEFIRFAGRHDGIVTKIFCAPGMWMQRITTKEPTDDIVEVAIAALNAVITENPEDDAL